MWSAPRTRYPRGSRIFSSLSARDSQARYPRFKSRKKSRASAEYTRSGFRYRDGELHLAKMTGPLAVVWSRPLPDGAGPSTVTVSRDPAGRWFVSLLCECAVEPHPASAAVIGVDAGITSLVTLSTGEKIPNPRHERRDRARLALAQRRLARTRKGSARAEPVDDRAILVPQEDQQLAQALADVATIGILQQRAAQRSAMLAEQLQRALNSRVVIEQAKGVLAERNGLSMAAAFDSLRTYARDQNIKLTDLAQAVVHDDFNPSWPTGRSPG